MSELGTQILVSDWAWKVPGIRARAEAALRSELERVGCRDITLSEPRYELQEPAEDTPPELQFEPYWAWEMMATGENDE